MFVTRAAQLQKGSSRVTCSGRTRGWRSTIGAPVAAGSLRCSTTVREVPRGSSTSTVYTRWPCSTPIPASARLPRHRHGLQQRPLGREVAHRQPVVSWLDRVRNGRRRIATPKLTIAETERSISSSCADLTPRRSPNVSDRAVSGDSGSSSDPLPSSLWTASQSTGRHRQLRRLCPVVQVFSSWETRWGETSSTTAMSAPDRPDSARSLAAARESAATSR